MQRNKKIQKRNNQRIRYCHKEITGFYQCVRCTIQKSECDPSSSLLLMLFNLILKKPSQSQIKKTHQVSVHRQIVVKSRE